MANGYEILAPAGSVDQLVAAVNNGCDAVYLGLDAFNARMKAPNFNAENLRHWVDFCHFFGVRVFVAVNTSVKNDELYRAAQTVRLAYDNFADGVIVTDLSLLQYAAQLAKPFEVVASTQLNVHDKEGATFLKNLGADTVVCARECSYEQIADIASAGVKVECFIHGALCVCQSGQCLFSSVVGGNSGNRGLCAQPCRKLYKACDGNRTEEGYFLSAKDICGLESAKKLYDLGVRTFKIEGRNRRAEYAGITSRVYSQLFSKGFQPEKDSRLQLSEMYNRGGLTSCNYLQGRNDGIIYPDAQNHIGVEVGEILNGSVATKLNLQKGDGLKLFDGSKEVCGGVVLESGTGTVRASFSGFVRDGMTVRRTTSKLLCDSVLGARRKVSVAVSLTALCGEKCVLQLKSGGVTVKVESEQIAQQARENATTKQEFAQQLSKTGDLPYTICDVVVETDNVFMPKSQVNALRRRGFEQLSKEIVNNYNAKFFVRDDVDTSFVPSHLPSTKVKTFLAVICRDEQQIKKVYTKADCVIFRPDEFDESTLRNLPSDVYLDLPSFADLNYFRKLFAFKKFRIVCHNVGHVQFARDLSVGYVVGSGLNVFNDGMVSLFADADAYFYSSELTLKEIAEFQNADGIVFVDGALTLMKLVHCPFKAVYRCDCKTCKYSKNLVYTDEFGNNFKILRRKDSRCTFELINGKKLSVVERLHSVGRYCVDFDERVVDHYFKLNCGVDDGYVEKEPYTKGRLYNKIN